MGRGAYNRMGRRALLSMSVLLATSACGTEQGDSKEPEASGFLRPVEAQAGVVQAAERLGLAEEGHQPRSASLPPGEVEAERPRRPEPPAAADQPPARKEGSAEPARLQEAPDEATLLELASALVHSDPAAFDQLLARKGQGLPDARRRLVLAVNELRAGQTQRATELAAGLESSQELSSRERSLLQRALRPDAPHAMPASLSAAAPLERALELALIEVQARRLADLGDSAGAARDLSRLLLAEISGPWEADRDTLARWSAALLAAQEKHRWNPRGDWPALEVSVRPGDSLIAIRKRVLAEHPELLLCTGLIARANGLRDEEAIQPDDVLRIPTDRASAIVDVSARWTFYLHAGEVVAAWEVGVGKEQGSTRPGTYAISVKQSEPMWFRPGREPVPFGAQGNPLGTRWLEWGEDGRGSHLGFHGTDDPSGVGGRVSEGCVRMRNEDVERLFDILPLGAEVVVQL